MKKLTIIILALFCFSCGGTTEVEEGKGFDFSYTVDTVMVDPGDGIVFLRLGLSTAALSPDQNQLYNFNPAASEMEIINLESLQITDRIQMEKEGPAGTGRPRKLVISLDGKAFFIGFTDLREFDPQLANMKTYKIREEKFEGFQPDESLDFDLTLSQNGKNVYAAYGSENDDLAKTGLAVLELENMSLKTYPLEIWERMHGYVRSFFKDGQMVSRSIELAYIDPLDNRILISSTNFNEVYILDLATDSISHKVFHSNLTENSKEIPEKVTFEVNSPAELEPIFAESEEQVSFSRFYYDDFNKKFWRFSRELDRKIGDSTVFKEVVTLFDEDLNQLHEEEFPGDYLGFKFFREGKLWSYVNVEDELGFAVFTFTF
ncbi:DUF4221 family protein [Algoriphagus sp. D3-2-R+10]|uniref:DUF4221 family protein n=1 Tax=Algoriphagus aurantiacus TaxID=3103948 RepID=UPI002B3D6E3F|nr:DUF4221 family protein [Algoriphagus sp. D3-2-R+10]MEB2776596.1 DUF4221 family protein [Algoriphagus sp. D3-2-R+10]